MMSKIRLQNLENIINEQFDNNWAKFARAIEKTPPYLQAIKTGLRPFSEKNARYMEEKLNLPNGYFDRNHDEQSSEEGIISVPRYSFKLSAGEGCDIFSEEIAGYEYLNREYVESKKWDTSKMCVIPVDGDSMLNTLISGEKILINTRQKELIDNRIFAIAKDGKAWIKRVIFNPIDMVYMITSDNSTYTRFDFPYDDACHVIGIAVHTLGRDL